jgi:hypothetical protein
VPLVRRAAGGGGVGLSQPIAAAMGQGGKIFFIASTFDYKL